uniref:Uncharacterized protein n=1 Tax=Bionectria ochroleuca TaxID=29856 RepID=A0A8H7NQG8_BIOOC
MTIVNQDEWQAQDATDGSRTSLDLGTFLRSSFQLPANTLTGADHPRLSQPSLQTKVSRVGSNHETATNPPVRLDLIIPIRNALFSLGRPLPHVPSHRSRAFMHHPRAYGTEIGRRAASAFQANRAGQRLRYEMSWLPRINLTPQRLYDIDGITIDRPLGEEGCTKDFVDSSSEVSSAVFTSEPLSEPDHVEEASVLQECNSLKTGESQHAPTDPRNSWAKLRAMHREAFSEFLATGVAVFLGLSGTLTVSLSLDSPVHYGTYETSCWS